MRMYFGKILFQALIASLLLASCYHELLDKKAIQLESNPIPSTIDYNEQDGSLSHLTYRAEFKYNAANQLISVADYLLPSAGIQSGTALPWVNFSYQNGRLSHIILRSNEGPFKEYSPDTDRKASRFSFVYKGDSVQTRYVIDGKQKGAYNFKVDSNGFPVRRNVRYGSIFLDAMGNVDFEAENSAAKSQNPMGSWETLEQTFDQNQNIFANSKEFQMLGVLLAVYDLNMITSLVPYLGILTLNNELSKKKRYCNSEGCQPANTIVSETVSFNRNGFPTHRLTQVGALGRYQYRINYKEN